MAGQRDYHLLLVDRDTLGLYGLVQALKDRDYVLVTAPTGAQANWWLEQWPIDLIVAPVRLTPQAGLSLIRAARRKYPEMAGILVGNDAERAFETDAWRYGIGFVVRPFDPAHLRCLVAEQLARVRRRQRWPRKTVAQEVPLTVGRYPARLVDVSYGGMRFEIDSERSSLPRRLAIAFPLSRMHVEAELVWSARASDGINSYCGVSLSAETSATPQWRRYVDALR